MRLAAAGYGVFGMDYEGHGKSMGRRCYIRSFRGLVDDCYCFFKSVSGEQFPSLVKCKPFLLNSYVLFVI